MIETKLTSNGVALRMALLYKIKNSQALALLYKQGSTSNGVALKMMLLYEKLKQWRCFTNLE